MRARGFLCNGPPKAATHLLLRIVQLFGIVRRNGLIKNQGCVYKAQHRWRSREWVERNSAGYCMPSHVAYEFRYEKPLMITILRDPRNIIISRFRAAKPEVKLSLIEHIHRTKNSKFCLDCFSGYLFDENYPVFFFENIIQNPLPELEKIKYLIQSKRDSQHVFEQMIGPNFTGQWSRWQDYLTSEVDQAFHEYGIHDLAKEWGYKD